MILEYTQWLLVVYNLFNDYQCTQKGETMTEGYSEIIPLETAIQPAVVERDEKGYSITETLVRMRKILGEKYPEKLDLLEINSKRDSDIAMVKAVSEVVDLNVKAGLAKEAIRHYVGTGEFLSAVDFLLAGDLQRASLPEYQNPVWVGRIYDEAMKEGSFADARMIAERMVNPETRKILVKYEPKAEERIEDRERGYIEEAKEDHQYREGWQLREKKAFDARVQRCILVLKENPQDHINASEAGFLIGQYYHRDGGWQSENPNLEAKQLAKEYCDWLTENTEGASQALEIAVLANLPQVKINHYYSQIPKQKGLSGLLERLEARASLWQARAGKLRASSSVG